MGGLHDSFCGDMSQPNPFVQPVIVATMNILDSVIFYTNDISIIVEYYVNKIEFCRGSFDI
jgi:hypothetical protein